MGLSEASAASSGSDTGFEQLLSKTDRFVIAVEIETSRGLMIERRWQRTADLARQLADFDQVDVLAITDNPGGHPHISPEVLGTELLSRGQEVNIHLSCKDFNRNGLESRLWTLGSLGFRNILTLTGDYPVEGFGGQALPVFDIDSVGLLELIQQFNSGLRVAGLKRGSTTQLKKTSIFPGAVVSPFKQTEGELIPQYLKLALKIETGAKYAVTQIGFDSRKLDELVKFVALRNMRIPLMGYVYTLSVPVARFFNRGVIPGVIVSDELLALANAQGNSQDKGRRFFQEFAAKQIAILKGLGYRGVQIAGRFKFEDVRTILEIERTFAPDDWKQFASEIIYPQPNEFHYFERDPESGLSTTEVNRDYLASKSPAALAAARRKLPLDYKFARLSHDVVFDPRSPGFKVGQVAYKKVDQSSSGTKKFLHTLEQAVKIPMFDCRDCGDCSLPDIAYLCPESQCVKNQRNGPCGGTHQGTCEIGEKECIWSRAYYRLKAHGEEESMLRRPVVMKDSRLIGTSAWGNTFLGRDHQGRVGEH